MHALGVEDEDEIKVDDDESKPVIIYDEDNLICDEFMTGSK